MSDHPNGYEILLKGSVDPGFCDWKGVTSQFLQFKKEEKFFGIDSQILVVSRDVPAVSSAQVKPIRIDPTVRGS